LREADSGKRILDNICHTLTGAALAQAGLKRSTSYAGATLMIASNLPDVDVLVFATDVPSVAFRRGWTHGVLAQAVLAVLLASAVYVIGRRRDPGGTRFPALLFLSYAGILGHVFMDYLNNYGIRPWMPWSGVWFYGDAVFISDIWLWLLFAAAVLLGANDRVGRARVAVALAALYIAGMLVSARAARTYVEAAWTAEHGSPPRALMVGPVPLTPFTRHVIVDAGDHYRVGTFTWLPARVRLSSETVLKNDTHPAVARARAADARVRGVLVWARFPFWRIEERAGETRVTLRDMRFARTNAGGFGATAILQP
jgi:inner membrane protein